MFYLHSPQIFRSAEIAVNSKGLNALVVNENHFLLVFTKFSRKNFLLFAKI